MRNKGGTASKFDPSGRETIRERERGECLCSKERAEVWVRCSTEREDEGNGGGFAVSSSLSLALGFFPLFWKKGVGKGSGREGQKDNLLGEAQRFQRKNLQILDLICTIFDSDPTVQNKNICDKMCGYTCSGSNLN